MSGSGLLLSSIRSVRVGLIALTVSTQALASRLNVPVMERADDDFDTCALGRVVGLKADGDGFLAVRSGPGTDYRKLDELHNEDLVWMFEQREGWIGIVYGIGDAMNCSAIEEDREVPHEGRKGWVHENWVEIVAG